MPPTGGFSSDVEEAISLLTDSGGKLYRSSGGGVSLASVLRQVPCLSDTQVMCTAGATLITFTKALESELSARNGGPERWLARYICSSKEPRHIAPLEERGLNLDTLEWFSNDARPTPVVGGADWQTICDYKRYMWDMSAAGASPCPTVTVFPVRFRIHA